MVEHPIQDFGGHDGVAEHGAPLDDRATERFDVTNVDPRS